MSPFPTKTVRIGHEHFFAPEVPVVSRTHQEVNMRSTRMYALSLFLWVLVLACAAAATRFVR